MDAVTAVKREMTSQTLFKCKNVLNCRMEENLMLDEMMQKLGTAANKGHKISKLTLGERTLGGDRGGLDLIPFARPYSWLVRFLVGPSQRLAEELTSHPTVEIEMKSVTGVRRYTLPITDPLIQPVKEGTDMLVSISFVVEIPDLEFPDVSLKDVFDAPSLSDCPEPCRGKDQATSKE